MKITHVRVSELVSGPGYNNRSCALEAEIGEGETYDGVATALRAMCKLQIKGANERDALWESVNVAREQLVDLERLDKSLRAEVEANRKIIRAHEKLAAMALDQGIDNDLPNNTIPF